MHVKEKKNQTQQLFHYDLHTKFAYLLLGGINLVFNYFYSNYMLLICGLVICYLQLQWTKHT